MVAAQAFGVNFLLPDEFQLAGLSGVRDQGRTPTTVRNDPDMLADVWDGARPHRTRELWEADVQLTVDHDQERGYLIQASGTGAALVSPDGLEVRCAPGPSDGSWKALLAGQILPLVATVRGLEVFHAAAVVRNGISYLIAAPQGVGKTSLAAHLVIAGAQLLSDDVVAVDDRLWAYPGISVLHLRDPALRRRAEGPLPGFRVLADTGSRTRLAAVGFPDAGPVGAIYLLERSDHGQTIEPLGDPSPLRLIAATFNLSVQTSIRLAHQFELCARLAVEIPLFRVRVRPDDGAEQLAGELCAHLDAGAAV